MIASERDRQALLRDAGDPVELQGRKLYGIFSSRFVRVILNDQAVAGQRSTLRCSNQDIDSCRIAPGEPVRGWLAKIRGEHYRVEAIEADSDGFSHLVLTKAS